MQMDAMPTTTGQPAATPATTSPHMDTAGSSTSVMSMPGASAMSMTFFHSVSTPLFVPGWAPGSTAAYAATCVFLVVLAAATRALFSARSVVEEAIWRGAAVAEGHAGQGEETEKAGAAERGRGKHAFRRLRDESLLREDRDAELATGQGPESASHLKGPSSSSASSAAEWLKMLLWWWQRLEVHTRLLQGLLEASLACLSYFLMLAVMTMNVGYFVSVLGGVLVGTAALGRRATSTQWQSHHC